MRSISSIIRYELLEIICSEYLLNWNGVHGFKHWVRVRENGLRIANINGADKKLVELFSFLHDSKRENDSWDPLHGKRAAAFTKKINNKFLKLKPSELKILMQACEDHSYGFTTGNITVQTCWDADRLDLGRVGVKPTPENLCTSAAKSIEMIEWAYNNSIKV